MEEPQNEIIETNNNKVVNSDAAGIDSNNPEESNNNMTSSNNININNITQNKLTSSKNLNEKLDLLNNSDSALQNMEINPDMEGLNMEIADEDNEDLF